MEKPLNMASKRNVTAFMILLALGFSLAAQTSGRQENSDVKVDYAALQQDILRFETAVNQVVNSTFSASPFAVVQKPKGAYLQPYGIAFTFLINIHRAVIRTPFGDVRSRPDMTPDLKKRLIEELKENLIRVLQDDGEVFRQLPKDDYVTIVAFIEDRNFPDEPVGNKTIVLSVLKKDLDELGQKNDRLKEFKQRMKIIEY